LEPAGVRKQSLTELIDAAVRKGEHGRADKALAQLAERAAVTSTDWGLGLTARSGALVSGDPDAAEPLYREAIERLRRARARPELARTHLLYGEWLRRENRRVDSREQLRAADDLFSEL